MFKFLEFSEFNGSNISSFYYHELSLLRNFYKCINLAEDSYLGLYAQTNDSLRHELQIAHKQDLAHVTAVPRIKPYRSAITGAAQLEANRHRALAHQQRKTLIKKLIETEFLTEQIEASDTPKEQRTLLQRLQHLANDSSLAFESYSTAALIALEEPMAEIPIMIMQLDKLKVHSHRTSIEKSYLKQLIKNLNGVRNDWTENLSDRLEKADATHDIRYSDNLFNIIAELNSLAPKFEFPSKARRDLNLISFTKVQEIIRAHGTPNQIKRLNNLSWNKGNEEFAQLNRATKGVQVVPVTIYTYLINQVNWLWYWLFASYRYRYHFFDKYCYLIAQQKLLQDKRTLTISDTTLSFAKINQELKQLGELEQSIQVAKTELANELCNEQLHFIKDHKKLQLITRYQSSLGKACELIISHKLSILANQVEAFKIYVYIPELKIAAESESLAFYKLPSTQAIIMGLYHEIIESLNNLNIDSANRLNFRLRALGLIIDQFYEIDPETRTAKIIYEPMRLRELALSPLPTLLALTEEQLKIELEHYQNGYQESRLKMDSAYAPTHASTVAVAPINPIEETLYLFILNYLEFIQANIAASAAYTDKLNLIENYLINTNPIVAGFLIDIQSCRNNTEDPNFKLKLNIRCRTLIAALKAKINTSPAVSRKSDHAVIENIALKSAANAPRFT